LPAVVVFIFLADVPCCSELTSMHRPSMIARDDLHFSLFEPVIG
jgi:hypothetical protein